MNIPTHSSARLKPLLESAVSDLSKSFEITFGSSWNHVSNFSTVKDGFSSSSESSCKHGNTLIWSIYRHNNDCLVANNILGEQKIGIWMTINLWHVVDNESTVVYNHRMRSNHVTHPLSNILLPLPSIHNPIFYNVHQNSNRNEAILYFVGL